MKRIKKLTKKILKKGTSGRNNQGRITVHHRGGGHKRLYRIIDFKRTLFNMGAIVKRIEYDPYRTANIALINYENGLLSYIIAPNELKEGAIIKSIKSDQGKNDWMDKDIKIEIGNTLALENMPIGTLIHNIELKPGHGGQLMRAAGTYAKVIKKDIEKGTVLIRLHNGKLYELSNKVLATVGSVSNENHKKNKLKKAGNSRWRNRRPTVRGVAMNPVDHPHGGGEGKSKGGRHPVSPWGKLTKGKATSYRRIRTRLK